MPNFSEIEVTFCGQTDVHHVTVEADPTGISPQSLPAEHLKSPCAIVRRCLHDPMFSHFGTTSSCDGQTDEQRTTAYTTLIQHRMVISKR